MYFNVIKFESSLERRILLKYSDERNIHLGFDYLLLSHLCGWRDSQVTRCLAA
jgi:hypothetical protein